MRNISPFALVVWSFTASAGDQIPVTDLNTVKTLPKPPVLTRGCEGECCGILKTNKALAEIPLYELPSKSSKRVGVVKKGEVFANADFFTKILKFGEMTVNGKKFTVVTYLAEGNSAIWDGKAVRATDCDMSDTCSGDSKESQTESWVQIKMKAGINGWANLPPKEGKALDYGGCG